MYPFFAKYFFRFFILVWHGSIGSFWAANLSDVTPMATVSATLNAFSSRVWWPLWNLSNVPPTATSLYFFVKVFHPIG